MILSNDDVIKGKHKSFDTLFCNSQHRGPRELDSPAYKIRGGSHWK